MARAPLSPELLSAIERVRAAERALAERGWRLALPLVEALRIGRAQVAPFERGWVEPLGAAQGASPLHADPDGLSGWRWFERRGAPVWQLSRAPAECAWPALSRSIEPAELGRSDAAELAAQIGAAPAESGLFAAPDGLRWLAEYCLLRAELGPGLARLAPERCDAPRVDAAMAVDPMAEADARAPVVAPIFAPVLALLQAACARASGAVALAEFERLAGLPRLKARGDSGAARRAAVALELWREAGFPLPLELVLAALLEPDPEDLDAREEAVLALRRLGASGGLRYRVQLLWAGQLRLRALGRRARELGLAELRQSERLRVLRREDWPLLLRWARAEARAAREAADWLEALEDFRRDFDPGELRPKLFLSSGDLTHARVPRGPQWQEMLEEAEDLQLDGILSSREAAISWLEARVLELQDGDHAQLGGKRRRNKKAKG